MEPQEPHTGPVPCTCPVCTAIRCSKKPLGGIVITFYKPAPPTPREQFLDKLRENAANN